MGTKRTLWAQGPARGRPGTSRDVAGTTRDVPGQSQDVLGTSQESPGTSRAVPGRPGTSPGLPRPPQNTQNLPKHTKIINKIKPLNPFYFILKWLRKISFIKSFIRLLLYVNNTNNYYNCFIYLISNFFEIFYYLLAKTKIFTKKPIYITD